MRFPVWLILPMLVAVPVAAQTAENQADESSLDLPDVYAHTRPKLEEGPTVVLVGLRLIDIPMIKDVEQAFIADFYLRLQWNDPRLARRLKKRELPFQTFRLQEVWHPGIQVLNERRLFRLMDDVVWVDAKGNVTYEQRFVGDMSARLDLRHFPLDEQVLQIQMVSIHYSPEEVSFVIDESLTSEHRGFSVIDWSIGPTFAQVVPFLAPSTEKERAQISIQVSAKRFINYYILKVILPLAIIVFMSWAVFWIDPDHLGPRVSVGATSVLTLIAYRFALASHLPRVSYLTRLDEFILTATILVFLGFVEALVTSNLAVQSHKPVAKRINLWSRWGFATAFVAITGFVFAR